MLPHYPLSTVGAIDWWTNKWFIGWLIASILVKKSNKPKIGKHIVLALKNNHCLAQYISQREVQVRVKNSFIIQSFVLEIMQIMHQCRQHIMAASFSLTILTILVQDEAVCQNKEVTFCECGITSESAKLRDCIGEWRKRSNFQTNMSILQEWQMQEVMSSHVRPSQVMAC